MPAPKKTAPKKTGAKRSNSIIWLRTAARRSYPRKA